MTDSDGFADDSDEVFIELQRMLDDMLAGRTPQSALPVGFDAAAFAKAAGLPGDAASIRKLFSTLQHALRHPSAVIDWNVARRTALDTAAAASAPEDSSAVLRAFPVAALWLDEHTELGTVSDAPRAITRVEWVQQSIDTWITLAAPVAQSISQAITDALASQLPEQLRDNKENLTLMVRGVAGALFATQLGQVIGKLAQEVAAGGDVGVPLFTGIGSEGGTLLPQGVADFARGLDQDAEAVALYLAVRELAHARLFRHIRWLRLHLITAITEYAQGISIDATRIEQLTCDLDVTDPAAMHQLLVSGALIAPKTAQQEAAHERLETMLALVEGWVEVVTEAAVSRLPGSEGIAEMVRRRRAAGGPAEHAFSTLVGLELRPRRMREAAALWRLIAERGDMQHRDALWAHPELLPTAEELDHPARLLERIGLAGSTPASAPEDAVDRELADLLDNNTPLTSDTRQANAGDGAAKGDGSDADPRETDDHQAS